MSDSVLTSQPDTGESFTHAASGEPGDTHPKISRVIPLTPGHFNVHLNSSGSITLPDGAGSIVPANIKISGPFTAAVSGDEMTPEPGHERAEELARSMREYLSTMFGSRRRNAFGLAGGTAAAGDLDGGSMPRGRLNSGPDGRIKSKVHADAERLLKRTEKLHNDLEQRHTKATQELEKANNKVKDLEGKLKDGRATQADLDRATLDAEAKGKYAELTGSALEKANNALRTANDALTEASKVDTVNKMTAVLPKEQEAKRALADAEALFKEARGAKRELNDAKRNLDEGKLRPDGEVPEKRAGTPDADAGLKTGVTTSADFKAAAADGGLDSRTVKILQDIGSGFKIGGSMVAGGFAGAFISAGLSYEVTRDLTGNETLASGMAKESFVAATPIYGAWDAYQDGRNVEAAIRLVSDVGAGALVILAAPKTLGTSFVGFTATDQLIEQGLREAAHAAGLDADPSLGRAAVNIYEAYKSLELLKELEPDELHTRIDHERDQQEDLINTFEDKYGLDDILSGVEAKKEKAAEWWGDQAEQMSAAEKLADPRAYGLAMDYYVRLQDKNPEMSKDAIDTLTRFAEMQGHIIQAEMTLRTEHVQPGSAPAPRASVKDKNPEQPRIEGHQGPAGSAL